MVIDTSAVLAILLGEPDGDAYQGIIVGTPIRKISVASVMEASFVLLSRHGDQGVSLLDDWLKTGSVEIVAADIDQMNLARDAWRRYGKGRHPAGLNFGDCFSYALAKHIGERLLYKGNDFAQTELA